MLRAQALFALTVAALLAVSAAEYAADVDLFELDPTAFAAASSPREAKVAQELLSIRDQIMPLHNQICKDNTSSGCLLRTRANAEIIQDVLSRRCYRKKGCAAASMGSCAKYGCAMLKKLAKKNANLQNKYTKLYKIYMGTYARYYRRRFQRLASVVHSTRAKLNAHIQKLKQENSKLKDEIKEVSAKANDAADDADDAAAAAKLSKNKLLNAVKRRAMAMAAAKRERAMVNRLKRAIAATRRAASMKGANKAKSHKAKVAFLTRHLRAARGKARGLTVMARNLSKQITRLRALVRVVLSRANIAAIRASKGNGRLAAKVRSLSAQAAQWKKRLAACQRGSASARRAHANLKRKTQQLAKNASNLKKAQHAGQINRNTKGGWKHVMTLGSASVLTSRAVGNSQSDSFKLSDAAINKIGGKNGVEFKIDFNGKPVYFRPVSTNGALRPLGLTSDVVQWKFKEKDSWQGPCGHKNQNKQYYWMFVKSNCRYGQTKCSCANSNYENAVYKSGFKNRDKSGFFPMQGWSPMIKVFAKKTSAVGKVTFTTRYTGADGRENGWVNNRILDFHKAGANTDVKLTYYDSMRIHRNHRNGGHCRWEIRVDGRSCPSGGIGGEVYLWQSGDLHRPRVITGYCRGIKQGRHRMQIWVSAHGHADCYTGWYTQQTSWTMEVQEIPIHHKAMGLYYRTGYGNADGKEEGYLNNRQLAFNKKRDDTYMRFLFKDDLRTHAGGGSHSCRWQLRVDNQQCPSGMIGADVYIWGAKNVHRPRVIMGYCKGIRKGNHHLRVYVTRTPGYGGDCYTGWQAHHNSWTLEAEEIFGQGSIQPVRHFRTAYGPQDGRDSGWVSGRRLDFTKKGPGALKVTYADNMRTYTSGAGKACRWEIRVDGNHCPSGRIAGDVYTWSHENSHRPRVITGFCKGVKPGRHDLRVYVSPTPGYGGSDCYTGWYSQQTSWTLEAIEVNEQK